MALPLNPPLVSRCNSIRAVVQHDNAVNDSNMSHFQQTYTLLSLYVCAQLSAAHGDPAGKDFCQAVNSRARGRI